ncbi:MAG: hypothetical protein JXR58_02510 [Bacteroidales bacterium]|nr:hypothetical protein [Bacteroidales bacterium]
MEDNDNIQDEIMRLFGEAGAENFSINEEQIDIDLQMEYFEFAGNLKETIKIKSSEILKTIPELFLEETSIHDKKKSLVLLATLDNPEAFRAIEKFSANSEGEIKEWSKLALHESRMLLNSSLLGEHQVFISTGLGGKGTNLRYCVVIISRKKSGYTQTQQKVITNEFSIHLNQVNGLMESIEFEEMNATIMCLLPIKVAVRDFFLEILNECNNYGNFIQKDFIVTNVKKLNANEISDFLKKNGKSESKDFFDEENEF